MEYAEVYTQERRQTISKEFLRLQDVCYLDHTGSTLYAESQIQAAMEDFRCNVYGNPHSLSTSSRYTTDVVDQVRYQVLQHFNTDMKEYSVIFTSGATSALKLLAETFDWCGENYFKSDDEKTFSLIKYDETPGTFTYLQDNHTSVLGMRELAAEKGASIQCLCNGDPFKFFENNEETVVENFYTYSGNSLFAYSAQCNFSGVKYPLSWIDKVQKGILNEKTKHSKWFCVLDAASYASTNFLDLSAVKPDFVCVSFYKIFGYPTGLGALLVKNSSAHALKKTYFGGGTVLISLSAERYHIPRPLLHEQFEDGTLPFLSIISLRHGFATLSSLVGSMTLVAQHTFNLARYLHHHLLSLHHANLSPVVVIYADTDYDDIETQGNIVNLNVLRENGDHVGYMEVLNMANLHNIQLRTGCFCNPGACQRHLQLSAEQLKSHFQAGHVCGDDKDLIDGVPTGSVRVSFGYMSTRNDADQFLNMIISCFVKGTPIMKTPSGWSQFVQKYRKKFKIHVNTPTRASESCKTSEDEVTVTASKISEEVTYLHQKKANSINHIRKQILTSEYLPTTSNGSNGSDLNIVHGVYPYHDKWRSWIGMPHSVPDSKGRLRDIFIYPVKSCGAFRVKSWEIGPRGLLLDREWMVVTASGVCLTQKQEPKLCLIEPSITTKCTLLTLKYRGDGFNRCDIVIPVKMGSSSSLTDVNACQSKVCGDRVLGWDCGDAVAKWLSDALGREGLRLIRQRDGDGRMPRQPRGEEATSSHSLSLSNKAQFLLISTASVEWLRDRLSEGTDVSVDNLMARFRANLIIHTDEPFAENKWRTVTIGNCCFQFESLCTRCQMICIDQSTGDKTKEPLRTLAELFCGKMRFGAYFTHVAKDEKLSVTCGADVLVNVEDPDVFTL